MPRFAFVFRGGGVAQQPPLSPSTMQAHLQKWGDWVAELTRKGLHEGGEPLYNQGKFVRGSDKVVTDGPYAESKDLVTGFMLITTGSLEQATTVATGCPIYDYGGSVEVRPIRERET